MAIVNSIGIKVFLENFQLRLKVPFAPKENMVSKFPSTATDQAFDKRVTPGAGGNSFDFFNVENILKVCLPKPVFE